MPAPFVVLLALGLVSPPPAVRVHVFTPPAADPAHPTEDERGRFEAAEEVRDALAHRRAEFTLTDRVEDAQVIVEVVNREERDMGTGGFGGKSVSRFRETLIRLRVRAGEEQGDLKGVGQGSWKSAAKDAAERLSKWVINHHAGGDDWQWLCLERWQLAGV